MYFQSQQPLNLEKLYKCSENLKKTRIVPTHLPRTYSKVHKKLLEQFVGSEVAQFSRMTQVENYSWEKITVSYFETKTSLNT